MKKLKSLFDNKKGEKKNFRYYLDFCASTGLPYTIIRTNYTLEIQSDFCNVYFIKNVKSKKSFSAFAKIKSDIKKTGLKIPEIDNSDLRYYNFNEIALPNITKEVYLIDIKSAYATVLKNASLIRPNTFNYLSKLDKEDRLACVGMLASNKKHFEMVGNKCNKFYQMRNENAPFFFYCIDTTHRIMNECKKEIGMDFLFFWVDGIFFQGVEHIPVIKKILSDLGYNCTLEACSEFQFIDNVEEKKIIYFKNEVKKEVSLPKKNAEVDQFLINFLNLHKKESSFKNQLKTKTEKHEKENQDFTKSK